MGQSTDAHLFYGYCWQGEEDTPNAILRPTEPDEDEGEIQWPEVIASFRGIENPWDDYYAQERERDEWREPVWQPRFDAWDEAKRGIEIEFGCDINAHCSCDYPMAYIHIVEPPDAKYGKNRGLFGAYRGSPTAIDPSHIAVDASVIEEWNQRLDRFVRALGISLEARDEYSKAPEGPGWFLVSMWCW